MSNGSEALPVKIPNCRKNMVEGSNMGMHLEAGIHKILLDISIVTTSIGVPNTAPIAR